MGQLKSVSLIEFVRFCRDNEVKQIATPLNTDLQDNVGALPLQKIDIPPMDEHAQRILAMRNNQELIEADLTKIIHQDPTLSTKIIVAANSPIYQLAQPCETLKRAIITIGAQKTLNIAIACALLKPFEGAMTKKYIDVYFNRSLTLAAIMQLVTRELQKHHRQLSHEKAYFIGLISEFGECIAAHCYSDDYQAIKTLAAMNPHCQQQHIERTVSSFTFSLLNQWVLKRWGLTTDILHALQHSSKSEYTLILDLTRSIYQYIQTSEYTDQAIYIAGQHHIDYFKLCEQIRERVA